MGRKGQYHQAGRERENCLGQPAVGYSGCYENCASRAAFRRLCCTVEYVRLNPAIAKVDGAFAMGSNISFVGDH